MSTNTGGILGTQHGKVGPVVGSTWKRIPVYRAYNKFVRNPKTAAQTENRTKFSFSVELARIFSKAVNFGFRHKADSESKTPRNIFVSKNFSLVTVTDGEPSIPTASLQNLLLAEGPMEQPPLATPTASALNISVVLDEWDGTGLALPSDRIAIVAYCPGKNSVKVFNDKSREDHGTILCECPASWADEKVEVYAFAYATVTEDTFVTDYNGFLYPNMASNSAFLGEVTLAS